MSLYEKGLVNFNNDLRCMLRHSMNLHSMLEIKKDHSIQENIRRSLTVPSIWEYTNSIGKWHYPDKRKLIVTWES